jgi:transposase
MRQVVRASMRSRYCRALVAWLQVDGYTAYNRVKDGRDNTPIELAYCWAHARRKLFVLTINNVAPIAEEGLKQIKIFYRIEAQIKGLSANERRA